MENQIYRIEMTDGHKLEFFVAETNELEPYREIKELGVCVLKDNFQLDGELDDSQIDSLMKFLTEAKEHIKNFNLNSQPEIED